MNKLVFFGLLLLPSVLFAQGQDKLDGAFQLLREAVDQGEVPGGIALVSRRGRILKHEAYGLSDLENQRPFATNTLCWIASITKPVTGWKRAHDNSFPWHETITNVGKIVISPSVAGG